MTVVHTLTPQGSSHGIGAGQALEDRFEVLKEIGDGSFGSVVLARVRSAGATVARRGTVVSYPDISCHDLRFSLTLACSTDCHQDNEENIRVGRTVHGAQGSSLPADASCSSPFGASARHFPGSLHQEASYCHGVYGRQPLSTDEGEGPQVFGQLKREEHLVPDHEGS